MSEPRDVRASPTGRDAYLVDAFDLGAAVTTMVLLVTTALGGGGPAAVAFAMVFVTFVPGWALLGWVPIVEGTSRVALAVVTSLTLCTAMAQSLLWLHLWHPVVLLVAVGLPSLFALLAHLLLTGLIFGPSRPR